MTAEPDVTVTELSAEDEWLIVSSDGESKGRKEVFFSFRVFFFSRERERERERERRETKRESSPLRPLPILLLLLLLLLQPSGLLINVERGGGGGLTNEQAIAIAQACGDAEEAARALVAAAVEAGSTDDVTVVVFKLGALKC